MPTTLLIVAAVAILIILLATASYKVCPADRVMVITGPGGRRFVSGGSAFIIPFIMRVDWLSLGAVQSLLRTDTPIPTKDAILIDVNAVANFQIASETMTVDENGKQLNVSSKWIVLFSKSTIGDTSFMRVWAYRRNRRGIFP